MRFYRTHTMTRTTALAALALLLAAACADASAPAPPTPEARATVVTSLRPGQPEVALVFETGVGAGSVVEILAILREARVRASFAVTGLWAEAHPALLNAIAADGHAIINGTYSGRSFTGASTGARPLTSDERTLELQRTETTVYRLANRTTRPFFFPPHGDIDASVLADVAAAGYTAAVLGSIDMRNSTDAIISPGAIVILGTDTDTPVVLRSVLSDVELGFAAVPLAP